MMAKPITKKTVNGESYNIDMKVYNASNVLLKDSAMVQNGETLKIVAEVTEGIQLEETPVLCAAVYDSIGSLVNASVDSAPFVDGKAVMETTILATGLAEGATLKLFLWTEGLKPIMSVFLIR